MVEDAKDEDDQPSGDDDDNPEHWPEMLPSDFESDDEYTAVSVWDELMEGILQSIGCTGMSSQLRAHHIISQSSYFLPFSG